MSKGIFFSVLAIFLHLLLNGQNVINVTSGKTTINLLEEVSLKEQFLDSKFEMGKVVFQDGSVSNALMNYNLLLNGIIFVDKSENTLLLKDIQEINYISYGKRMFIPYKNLILELIHSYSDNIALLLERKITIKDNKKEGLYGDPMETSAYTNVTSYTIGRSYKDFTNQVDVDIIQRYSYYIKKNDQIIKIQKVKDLMQIFPDKKNVLVDYINNSKLDPSRIDDLDKIILFCIN